MVAGEGTPGRRDEEANQADGSTVAAVLEGSGRGPYLAVAGQLSGASRTWPTARNGPSSWSGTADKSGLGDKNFPGSARARPGSETFRKRYLAGVKALLGGEDFQ